MKEVLNNSGRSKIHFSIVAVFVVLASYIVVISYFSNKTVSSARAYIAGEAQWTKAQKRATNELIKYMLTEDEQNYQAFRENLTVYKGDRMARETLSSQNPDIAVARKGFLQGNNHPEDISNMIWLFRWFKDFSYMKRAIDIWAEADRKIVVLEELASQIHQTVQSDDMTREKLKDFVNRVSVLDNELTALETAFSDTMGAAARWVNAFVFWSTVIMGFILLVVGYSVTRTHFERIRKVYEELSESEQKFRNVLKNSQDIIYQLDLATSRYVYMSPHIEEMLGFSAEEILEAGPEFILGRIHPEDQKGMVNDLELIEQEKIKTDFSTKSEYRIKRKDGEYIWISNIKALIENEEGEPEAIVGNVRDISEEKKKEFELEQSLREKRTLLEEIHHRVKNNLAIVSSLIELQKPDTDENEDVREMLSDIQSRIKSIAMIHEKLYKSETLSDINVKEYLNDLIDSVARAYGSKHKKIEIVKEIDPINLNINEGITLGLLINELLNNAYKHAFSEAGGGTLKVLLKKDNSHMKLTIADNGKGLPEDFSFEGGQSLGMTLISTLSGNLGSEMKVSGGEWTEFTMEIPTGEEESNS